MQSPRKLNEACKNNLYLCSQEIGFMTNLFRGMMKAPAGLPGGFFGKKARDILNPSPDNFDNGTNVGGNDLLAWNINRGRDHGLPRKDQACPIS